MINDSSGIVTNIIGKPYFSDNGKYVLSISADIEAGYSDNGFQLFKNENGILKLIAQYDPKVWGISSINWTNDYQLIMKCFTFNENMNFLNFYVKLEIRLLQ